MNQAFHLYRLQQVDTQIDQVDASLAELDRLLAGDEAVLRARQAIEDTSKVLHLEQQKLKQIEFAVHEQQVKIAQVEANLYSGRLHNPKEMQDLQKEIVSLKKYLAGLEDQQLESMLAVEDSENQVQAAQQELAQAQGAFAEKAAGWLGQREQLAHTRERLQAERNAGLSLISQESLRMYEAMRRRKSGVAVTTVREGSCTVCGATIRPSELQAARAAQELVTCSTCGRILYAG